MGTAAKGCVACVCVRTGEAGGGQDACLHAEQARGQAGAAQRSTVLCARQQQLLRLRMVEAASGGARAPSCVSLPPPPPPRPSRSPCRQCRPLHGPQQSQCPCSRGTAAQHAGARRLPAWLSAAAAAVQLLLCLLKQQGRTRSRTGGCSLLAAMTMEPLLPAAHDELPDWGERQPPLPCDWGGSTHARRAKQQQRGRKLTALWGWRAWFSELRGV